jgi:hypothetical protein
VDLVRNDRVFPLLKPDLRPSEFIRCKKLLTEIVTLTVTVSVFLRQNLAK